MTPEEANYKSKALVQSCPANSLLNQLSCLPLQAIDYYHRAMRLLGGRDGHVAVWDSVNWELSTTYFTLATLLQDYAPLSRKAQEQVGQRFEPTSNPQGCPAGCSKLLLGF